MDTCTTRRGFLSLTTCGAAAVRPCSACGRWTCNEHLSPASGFAQCLACANPGPARARGGQGPVAKAPVAGAPKVQAPVSPTSDTTRTRRAGPGDYDSDWSYHYREDYYAGGAYVPVAATFDHRDARSFERAPGDAATDEDAMGGAGFGDS